MYFVSEADVTVEDRHGNEQSFKAGVPEIAHPSIAHICESYGVHPCAAPDLTVLQADVSDLHERLQAAIRELMEAGNTKAFSAAGVPHLAALKKIVGEPVSDAQRDAAWEAVKAEE